MNPKARIAILNGLNNKDKRVSDFARHLIDREEMGASDATDSSTRVMALVKKCRKQSPDYKDDAEMERVCVAKPKASNRPIPTRSLPTEAASGLPVAMTQPAKPLSGPVKAGPDDFAVWSEEAKKEEQLSRKD